MVTALVFPIVSALPSVHEPPTPLSVIGQDNETLFVVIVLPDVVDEKVKVPVPFHT
jgi:hypothetical protein